MTEERSQSQDNHDEERRHRPDMGVFVSLLENAVYKGIAEEVSPYKLSPLDVYLLMTCMERGECMGTQLARLLPVDASRVSRLVTGLVDRGYLIRRRLREDRRIVMLRLSDDGQESASRVNRNMQAYYAKLTEGLSEDEIDAFAVAAQKIVSNYEAMHDL